MQLKMMIICEKNKEYSITKNPYRSHPTHLINESFSNDDQAQGRIDHNHNAVLVENSWVNVVSKKRRN